MKLHSPVFPQGIPLHFRQGWKRGAVLSQVPSSPYVAGFLEGIRTLKNCKRVPSFKGRLKREIGIQIELIAGTAVYIYEFSRRQAAKLKVKA